MKSEISKIGANGGGDIPEMCLSALQVLCFVASQPIISIVICEYYQYSSQLELINIRLLNKESMFLLLSNLLFLPQLALTGAPSSSYIYVFTDATHKDTHLEKTITALIRSTKSTVKLSILVSHAVLAIKIFTSPPSVSHFSISRPFFSGIFLTDSIKQEEKGIECIVTVSGVLWHGLGLWRSSHWGLQVQHLSSHWHYCWHLYFSPGMISVL